MANITITIPDASLTEVIDAVCAEHLYDATSGLTKAQFAKQVVVNLVKTAIKNQRAEALRIASINKLNDDIAALQLPSIT